MCGLCSIFKIVILFKKFVLKYFFYFKDLGKNKRSKIKILGELKKHVLDVFILLIFDENTRSLKIVKSYSLFPDEVIH